MPSLFLGVYTAIYDYTSQNDKEISLHEGDILCVLEKPSDDDWWKAKKKGNTLEDEEPVGLIPNNYIEEAHPIGRYKSLYGYTKQTEEEISFDEDVILSVYDLSDPDWALVGVGDSYGFAPANYIERIEILPHSGKQATNLTATTHLEDIVPNVSLRSENDYDRESTTLLPVTAQDGSAVRVRSPPSSEGSLSSPAFPPRSYEQERSRKAEHRQDHPWKPSPNSTPIIYTDSDDSEGPGLPQRRPGQPPYRPGDNSLSNPPIPPGFWTYPVQEVDSKKKRAATLGLGKTGIILLPDKSSRPKEEWSVDNLISYNYEGKHVFLEFEKPSRSLDLHAGSTNTAEEIVAALGDMRGTRKAAGLEEVIAAASGAKNSDIGTVLFDFPAQGQDEVSVTRGDEVIILDDTNHDWWLVRRQVNGVEGVVPRKYVGRGRKNLKVGIVESPGLPRDIHKKHAHAADITLGGVPERRSSLPPQGRKPTQSKSRPDHAQIRTWTDRLGKFEVEAQFLGYRDDKIHLHKINGVKIAVPVAKMSMKDIKYVEDKTGISLEDQKPLSEIIKRKRPQAGIIVDRSLNQTTISNPSPSLPTPRVSPKKDEYDWFEFFLNCGVDVNDCQRYAINFQKDNMDDSILADITPEIMRTLGMKEGDILRVSKKLEQKHEGRDHAGGLFSEPNGVLKNKTARSRPVPSIQTGTIVDPKIFSSNDKLGTPQLQSPTPASPAPPSPTTEDINPGFEDDAWVPKAPKTTPRIQNTVQSSFDIAQQLPTKTPPSGALKEMASLSLSTPPLEPTKVNSIPTISCINPSSPSQSLNFVPPSQSAAPRRRPTPPATSTSGTLGFPPPPSRPISAPQTFASTTQPITPMMTIAPNYPSASSLTTLPTPIGVQGSLSMMPTNIGYNSIAAGYSSHSFVPGPQGSNLPVTANVFQSNHQTLPTGMGISNFQSSQLSMSPNIPVTTGTSSYLPPPLIPQPTSSFTQTLQPTPTGPPLVRFGINGQKELTPQPTGRANLSKATPDNPFGF